MLFHELGWINNNSTQFHEVYITVFNSMNWNNFKITVCNSMNWYHITMGLSESGITSIVIYSL